MTSFLKSWFLVFVFWAAILAAWLLGTQYSLHFKYWWFDFGMHFLGGLWVFLLALVVKSHYEIEVTGAHQYVALALMLVGIVVLAGVIWEFFEFVLDRYILQT